MPTLDWLNRAEALKIVDAVPYRLLEHVSSHGDISQGNLLIQGDNLDALKALLPMYRGRVKCIFIDPPYNTKSAFEHYDDNLEHSQWLSMMYPRLLLLRELLALDGVIWVILDGSEMHYCKVLMDEIFGRQNLLSTVTTTTNDPSGFKATSASIFSTANYMLAYKKDKACKPLKKVWIAKGYDTGYSKVLVDRSLPHQKWTWVNIADVTAKKLGYSSVKEAKKNLPDTFEDEIAIFALENARRVFQLVAIGGGAAIKRRETIELSRKKREIVLMHPDEDVPDFYIANGRQLVFYDKRLAEINGTLMPAELVTDVWTDISWNGIGPEGAVDFKNGKKPEELIKRVLEMSTLPGDLVLDSFLGSGTTAAVAHKMSRNFIGVEMGEQINSHCLPRLLGVVNGEQSGISETVGWKGGGGFQFLKLGAPVFDESGAINPNVRFDTLAHFIWLQETQTASGKRFQKPLLGVHNGTAYYLLFNGILGDKRPQGGNVLTGSVIDMLRKQYPHDGPKVVYGEGCGLGAARLEAAGITFKHIPYEVKAR